MRDSDRQKRNMIIIGLCAVVLIMAVGFAVFSQQLQINSTSEVTGDWCIGFDNTKTNTYVATPGIQTGTTPTGSMTYSGGTCETKSQFGVTLASTFKQPGDSIEYTLTILNEGSLNAAIKSILVDNTSVTSDQTITKGNIKYKIEMPLSTSVAAGGSTTMKVTASFQNDTDITKSFGGDSASIEVKVNAQQDDGSGGFAPSGPKFTGTIYRNGTEEVNNNETSINSSVVSNWLVIVNGIEEPSLNNGIASLNNGSYYFNTHNDCTSFLTSLGVDEGVEFNNNTFTCSEKEVVYGNIVFTTSQTEIQSESNYYLKHTVVNDVITESYVCFVTDAEHCMRGGVDESDLSSKTIFNANKLVLQGQITWFSGHNGGCSLNTTNSSCAGGDFNDIFVSVGGHVFVKSKESVGIPPCHVLSDGSAFCHEYIYTN